MGLGIRTVCPSESTGHVLLIGSLVRSVGRQMTLARVLRLMGGVGWGEQLLRTIQSWAEASNLTTQNKHRESEITLIFIVLKLQQITDRAREVCFEKVSRNYIGCNIISATFLEGDV